MRIIITEGTYSDDLYKELGRHEIDAAPEMSVGELLEHAKELPFQMLCAPYVKHVLPSLYLMHSESKECLDASRTLRECGIMDGSVLRLMSGVR